MIQVADNFNYRGKKPNFDRDSFDTLQDMKNYSENSLDDGHISYCKETDKRYKFNSNNQSDPTTGKWVEQHEAVPADEEDITEQNGTLQLANKTYDKQSFSGLGRVYLRKNIVGDKNVLTQAMINKANTIYVIQYDYDLKEASINIPENCVLQFDGGSLCLVGASVNTTFSDINVKLTSQPEIVIEYIKSSNNQYSNVVSFLFTEDSKSKRDFYLSTNKDSEISKENPLIVTLFFTPLYHLTQILDGDKNWEINNGGYTKDIISINNYPFAYLENSNIVNNYRETLNKNIGNTSNRPIEASKGFQYFDTTINKPIFWDGSKWIDATGATV